LACAAGFDTLFPSRSQKSICTRPDVGEELPMSEAENAIERLQRAFPEERESLRPYSERAKAYSNECGCAMGGAFLVGSLALLILYGFFFNRFGRAGLIAYVFLGTAFVFGAGMAGKLAGIGVARIRLAMLYRHLRVKYRVKEGSYVHLH
jgi:hypothetical protein